MELRRYGDCLGRSFDGLRVHGIAGANATLRKDQRIAAGTSPLAIQIASEFKPEPHL
jgi:hypothetical protein